MRYKKEYEEIIEKGYTSILDLPEFNSVSFQDRKKLPKKEEVSIKNIPEDLDITVPMKKTITVNVDGEDFEIQAYVKETKSFYNGNHIEFLTVPAVGQRIKRKSKKYPNGVTLTRDILKNSKDFQEYKKEINDIVSTVDRYYLAKYLREIRESGLVNSKLLEAKKLEEAYKKAKDKKQFLIDNGFDKDNVEELFDFKMTSHSDGYGHTTGRALEIDFENKVLRIIGWSSDD